MPAERYEENYHRLVPAYLKGLSEYIDVPAIDEMHIWEMSLLKFGYRMVQQYMFSESIDDKAQIVNALQIIYAQWAVRDCWKSAIFENNEVMRISKTDFYSEWVNDIADGYDILKEIYT